jgi:hypothetical protein
MTLDRLNPLLAGAGTAAGGFLVWAALVCAQPDHRPASPRFVAAKGPSGRALHLEGSAALLVPDLRLPAGPFTAECWARCDQAYGTQSLFGNTVKGGFEIVWRDESPRHPAPWPTAWVRTERTLTSERPGWTGVPSAEPPTPDAWTHVAMTCDGTRVRLFVDGRLAGDRALLGAVVPGRAVFVIGADADSDSETKRTDHFCGALDEVRISRVVRYEESFRPRSRLETDGDTVLHLTFDDITSPWRDSSACAHDVRTAGFPQLEEVEGR